jgi:hypothetical protein
MVKRLMVLLMLAFFAMTGVGCCPITKLNVSIEMDEALRTSIGSRQLTVDIVAMTANENKRWEDYSMTQYWEADNALRKSLTNKVTLTLDPQKPGAQTIWATDPIWNKWMSGANEKDPPKIYVMVQLPGTWGPDKDKFGDQDPRRQILPTGSCRWDDSAGRPPTVKLLVTATGLITQTQQKRDKGK